ncbi:MAG TPA: RluA family pseudouridine synthase [Rectinemataceae bacterium]|nr:RluA family pseudouridine synthase [Rectinemataceae bacterium]
MRQFREFQAGPDDDGRRLDRIVRKFLPEASLPEIYRALRTGDIRLGQKKALPSTRVTADDRIQIAEIIFVSVSERGGRTGSQPRGKADAGKDIVLLETRHLLFISKPRGMLSHGHEGLDFLVRERYRDSIQTSLSFVPSPLHRLDRNTSGIIACSRSIEGARVFSTLLREGGLSKHYLAVVEGEARDSEDWVDSIHRDEALKISKVWTSEDEGMSRPAITRFRPLLSRQGLTLALFSIETGLTHQIRVQAAWHGHPLSGDGKYGGRAEAGASASGMDAHGGKAGAGSYVLHAWRLLFDRPPFDDVPSVIEAPLPAESAAILERHFGETWSSALPG